MDHQLKEKEKVEDLENRFDIKILSYHNNIAICEDKEKLFFIAVFKDGEINKRYYDTKERLTQVYSVYLSSDRFEVTLFRQTGLKIKAKRNVDLVGDTVICAESKHEFKPFVLDKNTYNSMNNTRLFY